MLWDFVITLKGNKQCAGFLECTLIDPGSGRLHERDAVKLTLTDI